jgi:predicted permease
LNRATLLAAAGISAAKLACYPVVVWCVLSRLPGVEHVWVQAGVLIAGLPSAGNTYVLAQRYATEPAQVAAAITLSTLVSVLSVPVVAWLVLRPG